MTTYRDDRIGLKLKADELESQVSDLEATLQRSEVQREEAERVSAQQADKIAALSQVDEGGTGELPNSKASRRWMTAVAAVVCLGVLAATMAATLRGPRLTDGHVITHANRQTPLTITRMDPPGPLHTILLTTDPPGAIVRLPASDRVLGETPLAIRIDHATDVHLSAKGHRSYTATLNTDRGEITIPLPIER